MFLGGVRGGARCVCGMAVWGLGGVRGWCWGQAGGCGPPLGWRLQQGHSLSPACRTPVCPGATSPPAPCAAPRPLAAIFYALTFPVQRPQLFVLSWPYFPQLEVGGWVGGWGWAASGQLPCCAWRAAPYPPAPPALQPPCGALRLLLSPPRLTPLPADLETGPSPATRAMRCSSSGGRRRWSLAWTSRATLRTARMQEPCPAEAAALLRSGPAEALLLLRPRRSSLGSSRIASPANPSTLRGCSGRSSGGASGTPILLCPPPTLSTSPATFALPCKPWRPSAPRPFSSLSSFFR